MNFRNNETLFHSLAESRARKKEKILNFPRFLLECVLQSHFREAVFFCFDRNDSAPGEKCRNGNGRENIINGQIVKKISHPILSHSIFPQSIFTYTLLHSLSSQLQSLTCLQIIRNINMDCSLRS